MKLDIVCAFGADTPFIAVVDAVEGQSIFVVESTEDKIVELLFDMVEAYNNREQNG